MGAHGAAFLGWYWFDKSSPFMDGYSGELDGWLGTLSSGKKPGHPKGQGEFTVVT